VLQQVLTHLLESAHGVVHACRKSMDQQWWAYIVRGLAVVAHSKQEVSEPAEQVGNLTGITPSRQECVKCRGLALPSEISVAARRLKTPGAV